MWRTVVQTFRPAGATRFITGTAVAPNTAQSAVQTTFVRYPYYVPRNSRGSLPVYTDVRNSGGRYLVLIRNVEGDAKVSCHNMGVDRRAAVM